MSLSESAKNIGFHLLRPFALGANLMRSKLVRAMSPNTTIWGLKKIAIEAAAVESTDNNWIILAIANNLVARVFSGRVSQTNDILDFPQPVLDVFALQLTAPDQRIDRTSNFMTVRASLLSCNITGTNLLYLCETIFKTGIREGANYYRERVFENLVSLNSAERTPPAVQPDLQAEVEYVLSLIQAVSPATQRRLVDLLKMHTWLFPALDCRIASS